MGAANAGGLLAMASDYAGAGIDLGIDIFGALSGSFGFHVCSEQ